MDSSGPDAIQVFWKRTSAFSEADSTSQVIAADARPHRYLFELPAIPDRALRIDPGSRAAYWRIESLRLYTGVEERRTEAPAWSCSPDTGFEPLTAGRGISLLGSESSYDFVCDDGDPQLFLSIPPLPAGSEQLILELSASVTSLDNLGLELGRQAVSWRQSLAKAEQDRLGALATAESLKAAVRELEAAKEQQCAATAALKDSFDAERALLAEAVRARELELRRARSTFAWAVVAAAGKIKHGYILPAVRALRRIGSDSPETEINPSEIRRAPALRAWLSSRLAPLFRLRCDLEVIPAATLKRLGVGNHSTWQSAEGDPQFEVTGVFPNGWILISFRVETASPSERTELFIDDGKGYLVGPSYDLGLANKKHHFFLFATPELDRIRIDPIEGAGRFKFSDVRLRRVTAAEVALRHRPKRSLRQAQASKSNAGAFPPRSSRRGLSAGRSGQPIPMASHDGPGTAYEPPMQMADYDAWLEVNEWNARREELLRARLGELQEAPLLSVVMPVFNPPVAFLNRAIESVAAQVYQRWELCVADDGSTDSGVLSALDRWMERDPRIQVVYRRQRGGISAATNTAAQLASGEMLVFLDHDDEMSPDALAEIALYLGRDPTADIIYSDSDKIDAEGRRYDPEFKPDWSPELLLSYMYMNHLLAVRADLFRAIGGERAQFDGAQDYDMALRATERTERIRHIPNVLYHWRALAGSTASSGRAKPDSFEAGRKALQEALERRGIAATAYQPEWAAQIGCGIFSHRFPDSGPSVTIIIPTRNNRELLSRCVESLEKTTYTGYRILIVDNCSDDAETLAYMATCGHQVLRVANPGDRFSFAYVNNQAARYASSEYIMFLNDDTEVISPRWLSQMVGYLGLPGVGAVGARLLFPSGRIQHAGVVHGFSKNVDHAFRDSEADDPGYLGYTMVARNYSAVTAACMLTPRQLFLDFDGFDEKAFPVTFNDADYCYRITRSGRRCAYCPTAELLHHEGHSRGYSVSPAERGAFRARYRDYCDPYYNPNLSLSNGAFLVDARTPAVPLTRPVRTLMCGHNLNREGAPYVQMEMTLGLRDRGVIDPLVYSPRDGPLRKEYESRGIEVKVFPAPFDLDPAGPVSYRAGIRSFAAWVAETGVEVVYGNTLLTFYAIAAARELDLPSIWNLRESEPWQSYFSPFGTSVAAGALECFEYPYKIVFPACASEWAFQALNSHNNFTTVHDGFDRGPFEKALGRWPRSEARKRLGLAEDQVMGLLVGTTCARKGQLDLVHALGRMTSRQARGLKFYIVGDRPSDYSDTLKQAHVDLSRNRRDKLTVVQDCADVALYYAAADIYLCTSRAESFPRVILEAMAAGLPIVTTPVHGIVEQVHEGSNAFFYHPGDVDGLAARICQLAGDPALRIEMGENSRYELESIIDYQQMVEAYREIFRGAWLSGRARHSLHP